MKIKKRNTLTSMGLFVILCIWMVFSSTEQVVAEDAEHYITDVTQITYTGSFSSTVNKFIVDDTYTALCIEHVKSTPSIGTELTFSPSNDEQLRKILYYGYGGPMEWDGFKSESHAIVSTALLLSHIYSGEGYNENCAEFKSYIDSAPDIPEYSITFSPTNVQAYVEGNIQRTPEITLQGDQRISITLCLPDNVSLVFSNGIVATGNVKIYGGTSFYLTAPTTKSDLWNSGTVYINETSYTPVIASTSEAYLQDIIFLIPDAPKGSSGLSVQWYNKGSLEIIKSSSNPEITNHNTNFSLLGATYGLYLSEADAKNGTNLIATLITDSMGYARADNLTANTYYIKELVAPSGYRLSDEVTKIIVNSLSTTSVSFSEEPITQAFQLTKYGEGKNGEKNPLAYAGFMACPTNQLSTDENGNYIWDETKAIPLCSDGSKEMFTDQSGYAKTIPLPYGTYLVRETTVPTNYLPINDFLVTIDSYSEEPKEMLYFTDQSFKAYIRLTKEDANTKEAILNNSASFKIWSIADEEYVSFTVTEGDKSYIIQEFQTDTNGTLLTPEPLMPGQYLIEETVPPSGYGLLSSTKGYVVDITNDTEYESYVDEAGETTDIGIFNVSVENIPITGQIKIYKTCEKRNLYQATEEYFTNVVPLQGITFNIYAADNIYSSDGQGTLLYQKGSIVETITTNVDGIAISSNLLPLGSYIIEETNTPKGYYKNQDISITLTEDNTLIEQDNHIVSVYELNITNKLIPIQPTTPLDSTTTDGIVLGESYVVPSTEDNSPILLLLSIAIFSLIGFIFLIYSLKTNHH